MKMSVSRARSSFPNLKIKKKYTGNKTQSKRQWKKPGNLIINQKFIIN